MSYPYSQTNRLAEPHNYMYTPFQDAALLQSYQLSRMAVVHRCAHAEYEKGAESDRMLVAHVVPTLEMLLDATSVEGGRKIRALLVNDGAQTSKSSGIKDDARLNSLAIGLNTLTTAEQVNTSDLLYALIAAKLSNTQDANAKIWLDRLIQRFEVTKKLYEFYPPGFRKGEGANTSIRLYWLFALALCLSYAKSSAIKHLSTLLKVSDLLCSLPDNELQESIPEYGLLAVLATEIVSIQLLAEQKGVEYEAK